MASVLGSIIASVNGKSYVKFVNELTGIECWTTAKVKDVEIISAADVSRNPLSTENVNESSVFSGLISDDIKTAKIILPVKLKVEILTDNLSLVQNILSTFADTTATIKISSKSIIAANMAMAHVSIDQTPEMISASKITIIFDQVKPSLAANDYNPAQSTDASNVNLGLQTLPAVNSTSTVGSIFSDSADAVTAVFNRLAKNIGI